MSNRRAELTAQDMRNRRFLSTARRPRKRLPRQVFPRNIEREYARALIRIVESVEVGLTPLLRELPHLLTSARNEIERLDAGESRRVADLIRQIQDGIQVSTSSLDSLASQFADKVLTHQRIQLSRQTTAALGVNVFQPGNGLAAAADAFTAENVSLIKNLSRKMLEEIEGVVQRGVTRGALHGDIAIEIRERFGIGRRRAKLIARDQVGKFYGNVQKQRQTSMGVEEFIWRASSDERVRPEHKRLNGERFKWSEGAPGEGIPGQPINCRCYAEPVFDDILDL